MKSKAATIVLLLVAVVLAVMLAKRHKEAVAEKQKDTETIHKLSNDFQRTDTLLKEQKNVNSTLETDLLTKKEQLKNLADNLAKVQNEAKAASAAQVAAEQKIIQVQTESKAAAEAAAKAAADSLARARKQAEEEMAKRDARISELEANRDDLTRKMEALTGSITNLEKSIKETERKLAASEGDREFLLKELKRMQAEKAALEKQMRDLSFLREQVSKLKEELSIARRLDWIRRGIYGAGDVKKGGQLLQEGLPVPAAKTNFNLEVEIKREGGAKVVPKTTNAPPTAPAPKK
ncbi:MAG: hypothetical protein HYZ36_08020 [Pedosphaera parvula]|nr:hypothetical protein [Pedosphaera parvula]